MNHAVSLRQTMWHMAPEPELRTMRALDVIHHVLLRRFHHVCDGRSPVRSRVVFLVWYSACLFGVDPIC